MNESKRSSFDVEVFLKVIVSPFELQLAGLWEEKLKEEQTRTGPLEEVCAALREALDAEHKKRMEAFESKMKPIIIKDGPSKKVTKNAAFLLLFVMKKKHELKQFVLLLV